MAQVEWGGTIRITIGILSRAAKLDLFRDFRDSKWYSDEGAPDDHIDFLEQVMATDAMVAAAATRQIEICEDGRWITIGKKPVTVTHDGESFTLVYPPTFDVINRCPAELGDEWVRIGVDRNGGLTTNMTFFTSLTGLRGKTSSAPSSDKPPSTIAETPDLKMTTTGQ